MTQPNHSSDNLSASFSTDDDSLSPENSASEISGVPTPAGIGNKIISGMVYGIAAIVMAATGVVLLSPSFAARTADFIPASLLGESTSAMGIGEGSSCSAGGCSMKSETSLVGADTGSSCCSSASCCSSSMAPCCSEGDIELTAVEEPQESEAENEPELSETTEADAVDNAVQAESDDDQPSD